MRIASWNLNSLRSRMTHLQTWAETADVDVIAVQETKVQDHDFPAAEIAALGYHCVFKGQKSYNGVALFAKEEPNLFASAIPGLDDHQARVLAADVGDMSVVNLYVPNGSEVGSEKYEYKLRWLDALISWLEQLLSERRNLVVVGDFNIAPEDRDVHDADAWRGRILCSDPERERLNALMTLGFVDCFRAENSATDEFSWWDYRGGNFRRNLGLRIDLVLAARDLAPALRQCWIDREPRSWDKPSDHAPVIADFAVN